MNNEKDLQQYPQQEEEKIQFTKKDILAIIIAQFEILMPMALIAAGIMALLIFILLKFFSH